MFEVVKDMNLPANCLCGYYVLTLRHVAGLVDLASMINLDFLSDLLLFTTS